MNNEWVNGYVAYTALRWGASLRQYQKSWVSRKYGLAIFIYIWMSIKIYMRSPTLQADSLPSEPPGKPKDIYEKFVYQFNSVGSDSLRPHGLQHARLPCSSPTPRACSNSCPSSWWSHPTILSSVIPFSSCFRSFPGSGSFPMSQFFTSGGQSIGVSALASVLPMNTKDWSPLGWTGWISLQSKGLSRVFSNTTVQKLQFLSAQLSL